MEICMKAVKQNTWAVDNGQAKSHLRYKGCLGNVPVVLWLYTMENNT